MLTHPTPEILPQSGSHGNSVSDSELASKSKATRTADPTTGPAKLRIAQAPVHLGSIWPPHLPRKQQKGLPMKTVVFPFGFPLAWGSQVLLSEAMLEPKGNKRSIGLCQGKCPHMQDPFQTLALAIIWGYSTNTHSMAPRRLKVIPSKREDHHVGKRHGFRARRENLLRHLALLPGTWKVAIALQREVQATQTGNKSHILGWCLFCVFVTYIILKLRYPRSNLDVSPLARVRSTPWMAMQHLFHACMCMCLCVYACQTLQVRG